MATATEPPSELGEVHQIPLDRDLAIIKMETEKVFALAAAQPRDYEEIKNVLLAQITAEPDLAREALYSKPVGKDAGKMRFARGLSIRAAEAIAEACGFNRVRIGMSPLDDFTVRLEVSFVDYQRCRSWVQEGLVSKRYRSRGGRTEVFSDDRFYNVVVKAEASKLVREAILRLVPPGLRIRLMQEIEAHLEKVLDESQIARIVEQFGAKGVTPDQIARHFGKEIGALTQDDRTVLVGVWNAIKAGETTAEEAFGDAANDNEKTQPSKPGARTAALAAKVNSGKEIKPDGDGK